MAMVYAQALRKLIALRKAGADLAPTTELMGIRLGDLALLAAPFEIFQAIKRDVVAGAATRVPLVMGISNDLLGYAPDRTAAARGGYAADTVPMILGQLPFLRIHDELAKALIGLDTDLNGDRA